MRNSLFLTSLALLPAIASQAQAQASRIEQVLVYPGGAQVERVLRLPAGATQARFACLPATLERDSLQIQAAPGVALGELQVETMPREQLPECRREESPRVRDLEAQRAALEAEQGGLELALGYLKNLSDRDAKPGPALAASLDTLRRSGQETLARQQALKKRMDELDRQLAAARGEAAVGNEGKTVAVVQLRLSALPAAGELTLHYRVSGAGWQPEYRARLDTTTGALTMERRAAVMQTSGEDWSDVRLRLSTTQPRQAVAPNALQPWRLDLAAPQAPMPAPAPVAAPRALSSRGAAPAMERMEVSGSRVGFDPQVFVGEFGTEYELPTRLTVRSHGQQLSLSLTQAPMDGVALYSRVQPQVDAVAWLVAEVARPTGSWPQGPLQLFRDGSLVGQTLLRLPAEARWDLFFGRDERLRVRVDPDQREGADAGFIGPRRESVITRQWQIENQRGKTVQLQVLEAAPVSQHEDIRVQTSFTPAVTTPNWREQPGLQLWSLPLAGGQTLAFKAVYRISVPREARVTGLR